MNEPQEKKFHPGWRLIAAFLILFDMAAVFISYFAALYLRDFNLNELLNGAGKLAFNQFLHFIPFACVGTVLIFLGLRLYRSMWRFAGYSEFVRSIIANVLSCVLHGLIITIIAKENIGTRMPMFYYAFGSLAQLILTTGIRFSFRFYLILQKHYEIKDVNAQELIEDGPYAGNIMIIGAGESGRLILRELNSSSKSAARVRCFIDDNANKWGRTIDGVLIVGGRDEILEAVEKYHIDKILVAIPSASTDSRRDILNICAETKCEVKTLPSILQLANSEVSIASLKDVQVEDLLGRDVIQVDNSEIFNNLSEKVVLVTGGGGSIGSELCRQIASHNPKQLIIFDVYENNAYNIQLELKKKYPSLNLETLIGSVRDSRRMDSIMESYSPDIVFHAAAHKHVPLMEDSPCEAVKNNVIGTYKTAYAAVKHGVKRFVLISTDKAVNPTNVMGASKRICEMVIQTINEYVHTGRVNELPNLFTHELMDQVEPLSG